MIYRILINGRDDSAFYQDVWNKREPPAEVRERLMGAFAANVPASWAGLGRPKIAVPRARFYFTEEGWRLVGRDVAAAAQRAGFVVKVVAAREPAKSRIVYEDPLQIAVLPPTRRTRGRRR
jgi:hypothetical protein